MEGANTGLLFVMLWGNQQQIVLLCYEIEIKISINNWSNCTKTLDHAVRLNRVCFKEDACNDLQIHHTIILHIVQSLMESHLCLRDQKQANKSV